MKEGRWVKPRHKVIFTLFRPLIRLWMRASFGYTGKKFKMAKNYLILANHTSGFDPIFLALSFPRKPIYFVSSDDLLRIPKVSFWLKYAANPIPKKKDTADINFVRISMKVAKEGGNIAIFPEGNRSYSGNLGPIDESVAKFAKHLGLPLLLYRIENGYGVDPRWGNKRRKGKIHGEVVKELSVEEIKKMDNQTLYETIKEGITSPLNHDLKYRSKKKAECLERALYICPKCHEWQTLVSKGNELSCSSCGLKVSYGEDMRFHSDDPEFKFITVADWYAFQKEELANASFMDNKNILQDEGVSAFFSKQNSPKKKVAEGKLRITTKGLYLENEFNPISLQFPAILGVGITGKNKIVCYTLEGDSYTFTGQKSFNAYKYSQVYAKIMGQLEQSL